MGSSVAMAMSSVYVLGNALRLRRVKLLMPENADVTKTRALPSRPSQRNSATEHSRPVPCAREWAYLRLLAVSKASTTAKTARPIRRFPARSTAIKSPSRMPTSQRQFPSTRHQNVDAGCRTTQAIGSISPSRSSAAGDGNPALAGVVTT